MLEKHDECESASMEQASYSLYHHPSQDTVAISDGDEIFGRPWWNWKTKTNKQNKHQEYMVWKTTMGLFFFLSHELWIRLSKIILCWRQQTRLQQFEAPVADQQI